MPRYTSPQERVGEGPILRAAHEWAEVGEVRIGSLTAGLGPPVVLLHGLAGSRRWWRPTIPALADEYRIHVPELFALRRAGRRFRPPPIAALAELLSEWMHKLDHGPVALVGHSMGGQLCIHIAARHPELVRRLVLVNSTGVPRPFRPAELLRLGRGFLPPAAWGAPTFLPTIGLDSIRAGLPALISATHSLLWDDVRPLLPRIEVPSAVVWGPLDPIVPLSCGRELARGIPRASLHLLPGAAHNPMIDRPEAFRRLLLEILAGRHD